MRLRWFVSRLSPEYGSRSPRSLSAILWLLLLGGCLGSTSAWAAQPASTATGYYHYSLAQIHLIKEDFPAAVQELELALQADPGSSEVHTELAKALTQVQQVQRAIEECQKAIELDDGNAEAHYVLGRIYLGTSVQDETRAKALKEFERVIELDPRHMGALMDAADMYWEKRDFEKAARMFEGMRLANPGYIHAYYSQAQALNELGRYQEAIEVLEDGLRFRDDLPDYLTLLMGLYKRVGTPEKGIHLLENALKSGPNPALERVLAIALVDADQGEKAIPLLEGLVGKYPAQLSLMQELGRAYRQARRLTEAAQTFETVLKTDPKNVQVNFELANIYAVMGEREQAAAKYRLLADMVGDDAERHRDLFLGHLGMVYEQDGQFDKAVEIFRGIVQHSPEDADANLRLFYALKQAGRFAEGAELTRQLVQLHPDNPFVLIARGQALADAESVTAGIRFLKDRIAEGGDPELLYIASSQIYLTRDAFEEAKLVVEEGLAHQPASEQLQFQLGAVCERLRDYGRAEEVFKKILEENPDQSDVLNYLGYMLAERGVRLDEALGYLQRAVEIDPYNGAYLDSLGWAYFQKEQWDEAEARLKKAVQLNGTDPTILEHMGDLYVKKGDVEQARFYYEASLEHAEKPDESVRVKSKLGELK